MLLADSAAHGAPQNKFYHSEATETFFTDHVWRLIQKNEI